jgi:hypothetical protein
MIEDKIKEYCNTEHGYDRICNAYECDFEGLAKDIAEICYEKIADEIYKLAAEKNSEIEKLQWKLDKDRIVGILNSWRVPATPGEGKMKEYFDCEDNITPDLIFETIAKEIIGE